MSTYAIGDLQGCHASLCLLLEKIAAVDQNAATAHYIFVGDLVNRGPQSLETLRTLYALGPRAHVVLGNHDLHLLATAQGLDQFGRNDTFEAVLQAPDRQQLLNWLRHQPLAYLHHDQLTQDPSCQDHLIIHAGVLAQWSVEKTLALADEVAQALRGPQWEDFLKNMYGNSPARWDDALSGQARLRCITNALTRMRYCYADGTMILDQYGKPDDSQAAVMPWFDVPGRLSADTTVVFGHWSAIGLQLQPRIIGLDSGCLWGGQLSAIRLEDRALFQVECPQYQAHSGGA
jgi:bis(5'-nucleosyl)-tetraphosphatase (symmetrical)